MQNTFSNFIQEKLNYYVYVYVDPRNKEIFYVGKGKGNRAFSHLFEISEKEKVKRILEIRRTGLEPTIEIVIHGIEDEEVAMRIEASLIDIIGMDKLTNIQRGYHSKTFGRMGIEQIKAIYGSKPAQVTDRVLAFRINKTFHYGMTARELYDYTRHSWKLSLRREKALYAFTVYHGIVQEVYEIEKWLPQNTTPNSKHKDGIVVEVNTERWEFVGHVATDTIRKKYILKDVSKYFLSNQLPHAYINC